MGWEQVGMLIVVVLTSYTGIKVINKLFDDNKKNKNSLF